jgi:UDP-N-acetylglucosamine 2-epimerase (non-hydrolysing)
MTLHRPSNVDREATLRGLVGAIAEVARRLPILFPVHPRTRKALEMLEGQGVSLTFGKGVIAQSGIHCMDPLGYLDFMALVAGSRIVLTDSGGIQEETTALGIPCLTLRENTERPVTVTHGTNRLVGTSPARIVEEATKILETPAGPSSPPPLWDGRASERIVKILLEYGNRPGRTARTT